MISVVVPVYNVLPYLEQCIDSILAQSYSSLEVILVDDGSTDGCSAVCDRYAERDLRVKVLHKANGGLSDARNVGVKAAVGEWIYFADSDDWLEPQALGKLYAFAVARDCEVVQGGLYYAYADYLLYRIAKRSELKRCVLGRYDAMRELIVNDRVKNFAWGKLYRTELIKDLEFPVGRFFEDCFWQHRVIDRVERYGIIDEPLYYYRQREDSISGGRSDNRTDLFDGYGERYDFIRQKYPGLQHIMKRKYEELCRELKGMGSGNLLQRLWKKVKSRVFGTKYGRLAI